MCKEGEAYLYSVYRGYGVHAIYRSKIDGSDSPNHGGPILRLPINDDFPFNGFAFAAVGSRFYMIAVGDMPPFYSTDIFVVETRNIVDGDIIMRRVPSVLRGPTVRPNRTVVEPVLRRQAVSIDGKVYLYSSDFSTFSLSGFEVFDPLTETSTVLPEPPIEMDKCTCCLAAVGTKLVLCQADLKSQKPWSWSYPYKPLSNTHKPMFVFDTSDWRGGWREVRDVYNPPWVQSFDTMPLATALGGGRGNNDDGGMLFHATVNPDTYGRFSPSPGTRTHFYHVIVKFDDDPNDLVRIVKWCRIKGVPRELARAPALADGRGCVIFACDSSHFDRSDDNDSIKFKRFSLARRFDPRTMEECYVAQQVSSSEVHLPPMDQLSLVASFLM